MKIKILITYNLSKEILKNNGFSSIITPKNATKGSKILKNDHKINKKTMSLNLIFIIYNKFYKIKHMH